MATGVSTSTTIAATTAARAGLAQQIGAFIEILLVGGWLGSMMFFSFAVAPSAFAVLPTREMAGMVVTSSIGKIEVLGMVCGAMLLLIHFSKWRVSHSSVSIKTLHALLLLLMIASAALSRFWVSPAMVSLRAQMGGRIDDFPLSDPLRLQFNDLHQYSVGLMSAAMLSGLVVLFFTVRSWLNR